MAERPEQLPFDDEQFPEALRRDLAELALPRVDVPPEVDAAVLSAARRHLAPSASSRGVLRRLAPWAALAAAAGVALLVWVEWPANQPSAVAPMPLASRAQPAPGASAIPAVPAGRVDILAAFDLARRLEAATKRHETLARQWDINGDGVVDQRDVDALAQQAVALPATNAPGTGGPHL